MDLIFCFYFKHYVRISILICRSFFNKVSQSLHFYEGFDHEKVVIFPVVSDFAISAILDIILQKMFSPPLPPKLMLVMRRNIVCGLHTSQALIVGWEWGDGDDKNIYLKAINFCEHKFLRHKFFATFIFANLTRNRKNLCRRKV